MKTEADTGEAESHRECLAEAQRIVRAALVDGAAAGEMAAAELDLATPDLRKGARALLAPMRRALQRIRAAIEVLDASTHAYVERANDALHETTARLRDAEGQAQQALARVARRDHAAISLGEELRARDGLVYREAADRRAADAASRLGSARRESDALVAALVHELQSAESARADDAARHEEEWAKVRLEHADEVSQLAARLQAETEAKEAVKKAMEQRLAEYEARLEECESRQVEVKQEVRQDGVNGDDEDGVGAAWRLATSRLLAERRRQGLPRTRSEADLLADCHLMRDEILRLRKVQADAVRFAEPGALKGGFSRQLLLLESAKSPKLLQPDPSVSWRGQQETSSLARPKQQGVTARAPPQPPPPGSMPGSRHAPGLQGGHQGLATSRSAQAIAQTRRCAEHVLHTTMQSSSSRGMLQDHAPPSSGGAHATSLEAEIAATGGYIAVTGRYVEVDVQQWRVGQAARERARRERQ